MGSQAVKRLPSVCNQPFCLCSVRVPVEIHNAKRFVVHVIILSIVTMMYISKGLQ